MKTLELSFQVTHGKNLIVKKLRLVCHLVVTLRNEGATSSEVTTEIWETAVKVTMYQMCGHNIVR